MVNPIHINRNVESRVNCIRNGESPSITQTLCTTKPLDQQHITKKHFIHTTFFRHSVCGTYTRSANK